MRFLKKFLFLIEDNSKSTLFSFQDFIYDIFENFQKEYGDIIDLEISNLDDDYFVFAPKDKLYYAIWEIIVPLYCMVCIGPYGKYLYFKLCRME